MNCYIRLNLFKILRWEPSKGSTLKSSQALGVVLTIEKYLEDRCKTRIKDSLRVFLMYFPSLQCMACGPELLGQCIGPDICCGPFGCQMGTSDSSVCQKENESTKACAISGPSCGSRNQGNCVADGICCDSGIYHFLSCNLIIFQLLWWYLSFLNLQQSLEEYKKEQCIDILKSLVW